MISVDTSAIVAIALDEPEGDAFSWAIANEGGIITTANAFEVHLVLSRKHLAEAGSLILQQRSIKLYPVDANLLTLARDAHDRFGRANHPAKLNFGDCFSYALAKATGYPLLFKGNDFSQTDVKVAIY